jgi:hypothetical protein
MYQTGICDTSDCDPVLAQAIRGLTWQQSSDKVAAEPTLHSFCPHADLRSAHSVHKPLLWIKISNLRWI